MQSTENNPKQVFRITIDEDGTGHWVIESRFLLSNDEEVEEFRDYAAAVAAGERDVAYDPELFRYYANEATDRTGREMSIENAGWDDSQVHSVENDSVVSSVNVENDDVRVGVIRYSFTWTNFATVDDDRLRVGDAFKTDTGVWFRLTETQRLVLSPPENYALETPTQLEWDGPEEFDEEELDIVFVQSGSGESPSPDPESSNWLVDRLFLFVIGVGVGIGSYLLARRNSDRDLSAWRGRVRDIAAAIGFAGLFDRTRSQTTDTDERRSAARASVDGGTNRSPAMDEDESVDDMILEFEEEVDEGIDPELLSDEERVLRMINRNGGRMKQASIVKETGWSNAKVSQLLSQMDEDGEIEKLRIGRENLITLPEVDPTELD
ncbi:hypothetical protein HTZ84_19895 [Haloterrigena sp. SYSU A558-1]|uniref:HTH iclR-type domain-containing protein n=1 Tax=Haloterrigena gelatinilytica TaxID=2741724 RepID=A0A8J8GI70_9EURY|nr:hypothetical protein [Haloterrigena gelatinilytica]NUC74532.1 hypothetical protein [Haloterrigena gelatinilytica]